MYYQHELPVLAARVWYNSIGQPVLPNIAAKNTEPTGGLAVRDL